jgi:quercetin dioxygenase-like cupin family protein
MRWAAAEEGGDVTADGNRQGTGWARFRAGLLVVLAMCAGLVIYGASTSSVNEASESAAPGSAEAVAMTDAAAPTDATAASDAADAPPIVSAPGRAAFAPAPGLPEGSTRSLLRTDPVTGGVEQYLRLPAGAHVPPHWHSSAEWIVVIEGSVTLRIADTRHEMKPGSYAYIPARAVHEAWIGSEGVLACQRTGATPDRFAVEGGDAGIE